MKILKENLSIEILNEMLKNLETNFAKKLLDILLETPDRNDFSQSYIRKIWYELSEHPGKSFGQNSPSYWTLRGWGIEDANCKRKQFQKSVPNKSPFATKTYENTINPKTGLIFRCAPSLYRPTLLQVKQKRVPRLLRVLCLLSTRTAVP